MHFVVASQQHAQGDPVVIAGSRHKPLLEVVSKFVPVEFKGLRGRRPRDAVRDELRRYPSDVSDEEWGFLAPYRKRCREETLNDGHSGFHARSVFENAEKASAAHYSSRPGVEGISSLQGRSLMAAGHSRATDTSFWVDIVTGEILDVAAAFGNEARSSYAEV
jgi:hypothetical protein